MLHKFITKNKIDLFIVNLTRMLDFRPTWQVLLLLSRKYLRNCFTIMKFWFVLFTIFTLFIHKLRLNLILNHSRFISSHIWDICFSPFLDLTLYSINLIILPSGKRWDINKLFISSQSDFSLVLSILGFPSATNFNFGLGSCGEKSVIFAQFSL